MLNIGSINLPPQSATRTFAILAKRGAGKSYTAAVMAEEFHKNRIPSIIFDPIDIHWGLRLNKNGKDKGLPVVVFGREHSDIPLDKSMGRVIAEAIIKDNISCIISTFGMGKSATRYFMTEFALALLDLNNTPRHIFIEEAHQFLPQRLEHGQEAMFSAINDLVVMGRNRGLGVTLINQRAATINKDALTQIDTLLAFRNVAPEDRKALKGWVEHHLAEGDFEEFMDSLPSLPTSEGWIWSPEFLQVFKKIRIRERETFHPDREKLGSKFGNIRLTNVAVEDFISKFQKRVVELSTTQPPPKSPASKGVTSIPVPKAHSDQALLTKIASLEAKNTALEQKYEAEHESHRRTMSERNQAVAKLDLVKQFLKPQYETLKEVFNHLQDAPDQQLIPKTKYQIYLDRFEKESAGRKVFEDLIEHGKGSRSQICFRTGVAPVKNGAFDKTMQKLSRMNIVRSEGIGKERIYYLAEIE